MDIVVREHHPVEEGLRLLVKGLTIEEDDVREHHPVEEGLRLSKNVFDKCLLMSESIIQ